MAKNGDFPEKLIRVMAELAGQGVELRIEVQESAGERPAASS